MEEELFKIQKRLKPLIDGNWANDNIGELEEMKSEIKLIGDLLIFIISYLIERKILDVNIIEVEYSEGWKIEDKDRRT